MASPSGPMQTPPFLTKLFQLVSDPATNELVSWSNEAGLSFTVHKPSEFGRDVLPQYFKHNNFSSFVRQLNQYGFHKQNPDKWMFGHDSFRRDKPELLRNITRRRPKQQQQSTNSSSSQAVVAPGQSLGTKAVVELGNFGIEGEVKALKRDKDLLIKELVVTRQAEEKLRNKCDELETRMETLENSSKQMQAFIMHYFSQVLQPYSQAMASKKRKRITASTSSDMLDVIGDTAGPSRASSQPVTHPPANGTSMDALRVMMQQMQMNMARAPATPRVRPGQSLAQTALVQGPPSPNTPEITFEPATVQELPQDDNPVGSPPTVGNVLPTVTVSGLGGNSIANGTISVQDVDESRSADADDEVLDFLKDMPSTPNSSLTMDAIETALKEPNERTNGRTHLDTPDLSGGDLNDNKSGCPNDKPAGTPCDSERDKKAIEDFLDLDSDDAPLPPPLTHLPEGTDIHALAMRIEGLTGREEDG